MKLGDIKALINKRHSVREYKAGEIPVEVISETVIYAEKAPSAGGLRAYRTFLIKRSKEIKKLAEIAHQNWIGDASVIFVLCTDPRKSAEKYGKRGRGLYCIQDATLYGAYLDLLFVNKGYGTCWVGAFDERQVRDYLKISKYLVPISFLVVGKEKNEKRENN